MYLLMLRQIEEQSRLARAALARLEESVAVATKTDPHTLILDWLQEELMGLHKNGSDPEDTGARLLRQAVGLCGNLKS